jgi:arylsulfatase A-like enzyme
MTNQWTRRQVLWTAAMAAPKKKHPPPNVLLILTSQHNIRGIGAAGNKHVRTPNLDSLVRGGTSFANSWCTSPVGSAGLGSILTGCLPHTAGVDKLGQGIEAKVPTLGELFRRYGYETAWAGRWNLPTSAPGARFPNTPATPPTPADERGFDFVTFPVNDKSQEPYGDFTDERIAQATANYISKRHTSPYLLAMSLHNPHDICYWAQGTLPKGHPGLRAEEGKDAQLPPLTPNFQIASDEPEFVANGRRELASAKWDEKRWRQYLYVYYRMIERIDYCVGVVLTEIHRRRMEENVLIVVTSDRGEGMGAHHWAMEPTLYQEPLSVPLVFCWKDWIHANRVERTALASGMDLLPTLCDLTGVAPPKYLQGSSLRPVLESTSGEFRGSVFAEQGQSRAVRTERWKYISFQSGKNPEMLFDLHADPGETRNLAGAAEHKEELALHRDLAAKWAESDRL